MNNNYDPKNNDKIILHLIEIIFINIIINILFFRYHKNKKLY